MKWKEFMKRDWRKMTLFFLFILILFMFHFILFVLANNPASDVIYSMATAYISVPLYIIEVVIQDPLFHGTPLWLVTFYLLTAIYLYLVSYSIIWIYDKVKKK